MSTILIGVGHPCRGDDAAGLEVAKRVRSVRTHESMTGAYELMDLWTADDEVIVVDATRSDAAPGTILRLEAADGPLPAGTFASTHTVGLIETIELARRLNRLPRRLRLIGIEADDLTMGAGLSAPVAAAVEAVARELDHA